MAAPLGLDLALAGVAVGSAAALSGIGLVVCYRATGVLNFAQGAIAMLSAYVLRQTVVVFAGEPGSAPRSAPRSAPGPEPGQRSGTAAARPPW